VLPVSLEIKLHAQTREVAQHREFELNVLDGQCLDRRVTDEAILKAEYHRLESRPERHASSDENWYNQEGSAGRDAIPDT